MPTSVSSASLGGYTSGADWQSLINAILDSETSQSLTPVQAKITQTNQKLSAWSQYSSLVSSFQAKAKALATGTPFNAMKASAPVSASSGASLYSITADPGAAAGTYDVEVRQLASAAKLGSTFVSDAAAALNLSGSFTINGRKVDVVAGDSLNTLRDKINAVNIGTTASRVSAATLVSNGKTRLVLTAQDTGANGIELVDAASSGPLAGIGLVTAGTTVANANAAGQAQSYGMSSADVAVGALLGLDNPGVTTINASVNGTTSAISLNLGTDTLNDVQAKFAATGLAASVQTETVGGQLRYRLVVDGSVSDAGTAASARTLAELGLTRPASSAIAQVRSQTVQLQDGTALAPATGTSLLTALGNTTTPAFAAGDVITVQGTRADGVSFSKAITVTNANTVNDVLATLNASDAFGGGAKPSVVSMVNGQFVLTDSVGGASLATLAFSKDNAGGGSAVNFGAMTVTTTGAAREIVAGQDAIVRIDGTIVTKSTNILPDVIPSATLSLQHAEPGTVVTATIARDSDAALKAVQDFATAYNAVVDFTKQQTAARGAFEVGGSSLRALTRSLTEQLSKQVVGLSASAPYHGEGVLGVALDKSGHLQVDSTVFKAALQSNPDDVANVFGLKGTSTNTALTFTSATDKTSAKAFAVNITAAATMASVTGAALGGGSYVDDASSDQMTIKDIASGKSATIVLANGDTLATVASKLNAAFAANGVRVTASVANAKLKLDGRDFGSTSGFKISYSGQGADNTAQLGVAAGTYVGTDVAGTIDGVAATGIGQTLSGAAGSAAQGLVLQYTAAALGAIGSVSVSRGIGQLVWEAADVIARGGDGIVNLQQNSLAQALTTLQSRASNVQARLTRHKAALQSQFSQIDGMISRIKAQGSEVAGRLASLANG